MIFSTHFKLLCNYQTSPVMSCRLNGGVTWTPVSATEGPDLSDSSGDISSSSNLYLPITIFPLSPLHSGIPNLSQAL